MDVQATHNGILNIHENTNMTNEYFVPFNDEVEQKKDQPGFWSHPFRPMMIVEPKRPFYNSNWLNFRCYVFSLVLERIANNALEAFTLQSIGLPNPGFNALLCIRQKGTTSTI